MKTCRVLAIVGFFVLLIQALAQTRILKANVPLDFVVGAKTMPAAA